VSDGTPVRDQGTDPIIKRFLYAGFESGMRLRRPDSGYERTNENMSFTAKSCQSSYFADSPTDLRSSAETPRIEEAYSKAKRGCQ
jgi:hypothetical protein